MSKLEIQIGARINAPVDQVWKCWTSAEDIIHWNAASDDWHTPAADNDLQVGGQFNYRMEARDGSFGFDFIGTYTRVEPNQHIEYTLGDDRRVKVIFTPEGPETTLVEEHFEAEDQNSADMQRQGWQAILDRFKAYVEELRDHE